MRVMLNREGAKDAKKKGRAPLEPSDFFRHFFAAFAPSR
jgi:hypothetical protein